MLTLDDHPAYFARLAGIEAQHWWSASLWQLAAYWLDHELRGRQDLRALDVGCGAGFTLQRLGRRREIGEVIGLEPSATALNHARWHGRPLVLGDARDLPFGDGQFDLVTSLDVWQHLPLGGDRRAAAELRRVLRPGGLALIRVNCRGLAKPAESVDLYHRERLAGVLASSGLRIRYLTPVNCLPALAQELLGRFRPRDDHSPLSRPHPGGGGLRIRVSGPRVNRLMVMVGGAEAFVAGRLGLRLPFGHSLMALASRGA